jgi:GntR family transcriptional repressor for pyruvate dehydrogenase complex
VSSTTWRIAVRGPPSVRAVFVHRLVAVATHNRVYPLLFHALMELEADFVVQRYRLTARDQATVDEAHREVLEAIRHKDGDGAEAAMRRHVIAVRDRVRRSAPRGERPTGDRP